jgi:hypothetical protein
MSSFKTTRRKIVYGLVATLAWTLFFYGNVYKELPATLEAARANSRIVG